MCNLFLPWIALWSCSWFRFNFQPNLRTYYLFPSFETFKRSFEQIQNGKQIILKMVIVFSISLRPFKRKSMHFLLSVWALSCCDHQNLVCLCFIRNLAAYKWLRGNMDDINFRVSHVSFLSTNDDDQQQWPKPNTKNKESVYDKFTSQIQALLCTYLRIHTYQSYI